MIVGIVIVSLLLIGSGLMHYFMSTFSDKGTFAALDTNRVPYEKSQVAYGDYEISAIRVGDPDKPKVLLIHGSPGHWYDWEHVITNPDLLANFCMIAYDRPGYGGTTIPPVRELSEQADVAAAVMKYYCSNNVNTYAVAGHSYGGGVVEQLLLDYPDMAGKGVYVAGTLSPDHQKRKWYNYAANLWVVQWLLPKEMRSSNREMMSLAESTRTQC